MEPLSVGVHSVATLARFKTGQTIASGEPDQTDSCAWLSRKALGASRIVAVDRNQARSDFAESCATDAAALPARRILLLQAN
jgi:D-xylulose reductase